MWMKVGHLKYVGEKVDGRKSNVFLVQKQIM